MSVLQRSWADIEELDDTEFYQEFEKTIKIFGKVQIEKSSLLIEKNVSKLPAKDPLMNQYVEVVKEPVIEVEIIEVAMPVATEMKEPEISVAAPIAVVKDSYVDAVKGPESVKEYVDAVRGHITEKVPIEPEPIVEVKIEKIEPPVKPKRVPKKFTEADLSKIKNLMILKN